MGLPADASLGSDEIERHVRLRLPRVSEGSSNATMVEREYTPVSPLSKLGSFDLAIKVYPDGALTQMLSKKGVGDCIEMCGPFGDVTIHWSTHTVSKVQTELTFNKLVLIAAGSGVTPMIQIL